MIRTLFYPFVFLWHLFTYPVKFFLIKNGLIKYSSIIINSTQLDEKTGEQVTVSFGPYFDSWYTSEDKNFRLRPMVTLGRERMGANFPINRDMDLIERATEVYFYNDSDEPVVAELLSLCPQNFASVPGPYINHDSFAAVTVPAGEHMVFPAELDLTIPYIQRCSIMVIIQVADKIYEVETLAERMPLS